MRLTQKQQDILVQWLVAHDVAGLCPACRHPYGEWSTGEIFSGKAHIPEDIDLVGREIPMLQLVCPNCGFIWLFDAVMLGLM